MAASLTWLCIPFGSRHKHSLAAKHRRCAIGRQHIKVYTDAMIGDLPPATCAEFDSQSCAVHVRLLFIPMKRDDTQDSDTAIRSTNRASSARLCSAWRRTANSGRAGCAIHIKRLLGSMQRHKAQQFGAAILSTNKGHSEGLHFVCCQGANSFGTSCVALPDSSRSPSKARCPGSHAAVSSTSRPHRIGPQSASH